MTSLNCRWKPSAAFFHGLKFTGREALIARDILPEIAERLKFLDEVGLGYLQFGRSVTTLSGGEAQRIRLAAQLGSNLCGVLYVLDEPTIGLHARDNVQLLAALEQLRSRGNSLVVVEHDEETMRRADYIIDLGPGAGVEGGTVVAHGTLEELLRHDDSITGRCLRAHKKYPTRGQRRPVTPGAKANQPAPEKRKGKSPGILNTTPTQALILRGASVHNLRGPHRLIPAEPFRGRHGRQWFWKKHADSRMPVTRAGTSAAKGQRREDQRRSARR